MYVQIPPVSIVVDIYDNDQWHYLNCDDAELWSSDNPGQFIVAEILQWIEW